MNWNDRRKEKKAASNTTKLQLAAMAKQGTLKAAVTSPGQRNFGRAERAAVREEVAKSPDWGSRASRWSAAAKKVDKAKDVGGYDGPAYRKSAEQNNARGIQPKRWLPKKAGK